MIMLQHCLVLKKINATPMLLAILYFIQSTVSGKKQRHSYAAQLANMRFFTVLTPTIGLIPFTMASVQPYQWFILRAESLPGDDKQFHHRSLYSTSFYDTGVAYSSLTGTGYFFRLVDPRTSHNNTRYSLQESTYVSEPPYIGLATAQIQDFISGLLLPMIWIQGNGTGTKASSEDFGFYVEDTGTNMYLRWTDDPKTPSTHKIGACLGKSCCHLGGGRQGYVLTKFKP